MKETIFEKSQSGQRAFSLPKDDSKFTKFLPQGVLRRVPLNLPELSELDLTRHFSLLAQKNMSIDTNFYPLGSCTMKVNPRINEQCAKLPGFTRTHPLAPDASVQGNLELWDNLLKDLCAICGMDAGSLLPNAGAQGEFVGVKMMAAYHRSRGDNHRTEILIPDSAHGTNPATAALAGFKTVPVKTNSAGDLDLDDLEKKASQNSVGLMLTNPNTLGLFSSAIQEICRLVHRAGGLVFCDGANMNAILEIARPGDMGFDVMHLNLHKTFSTPHGGGGPGSGPVLCKDILREFLPLPKVCKKGDQYEVIWHDPASIGQIASFFGNFSTYLRAYLYIKMKGRYGLRKVSEQAVLNANYLKIQLKDLFTVPYPQPCMHEFVVQADRFVDKGVKAVDIAKRLLDYGIHAPTIYFPLIIKECLLIEPTECESKATLDRFVEVMRKIVQEIEENPDIIKNSPLNLSIHRLNEKRALEKIYGEI